MTLAEIAADACINCARSVAYGRVVEPWGVVCPECDEAMQAREDDYAEARVDTAYAYGC